MKYFKLPYIHGSGSISATLFLAAWSEFLLLRSNLSVLPSLRLPLLQNESPPLASHHKKGFSHEAMNCRLVDRTAFTSRLMERNIKEQMANFLISLDFITSSQQGFLGSKECLTCYLDLPNLVIMNDDIRRSGLNFRTWKKLLILFSLQKWNAISQKNITFTNIISSFWMLSSYRY